MVIIHSSKKKQNIVIALKKSQFSINNTVFEVTLLYYHPPHLNLSPWVKCSARQMVIQSATRQTSLLATSLTHSTHRMPPKAKSSRIHPPVTLPLNILPITFVELW